VIVLGLGFCLAYASNAFDTKKKDLKNKIKNEEI
jgi:hypothetical protein